MPVAKVIEISSTSEQSFEDAIRRGVARATRSLRGVQSAWVKEQQVSIEGGEIAGYRVNLMITFVMDDGDGLDDEDLDEED
jgi:flavin-binding protein dodecin